MKFKFSFALLTFSIALFASGRFERFITHSQSYGNVVWAQDASDPEPIVDASAGTTTLTIDIFQNKSKLKGTWSAPGAGGSFKGKISSDGMTVLFKFKGHHGCKVTAPGMFDSATEISGTYTSKHCSGITTGTFDLTLQP
jgi:hypothetical protein